jgi:death-on-curing protein
VSVQYLDVGLMKKMCHPLAVAIFDTEKDPISQFDEHDISRLESALGNPRQTFDGKDLYPTLTDKAAILYYTLSKNHAFLNGNKRIATASLLVFLYINGRWLIVEPFELADFTLWVANSEAIDKDKVLNKIIEFINKYLTEKS